MNDPFGSAVPEVIDANLLKDKNLLWWGQPAQGVMLTSRDVFLIPFSLLWGGFAIFWEATVLRSQCPTFFALFGIPLVLMGLFLIFGRFLLDMWLRRRMTYALTDRRVLIARTGPWQSFKSISCDRLPEVTLDGGQDGRGTIRFGPQVPIWANPQMGGAWTPALDPTPQFLRIDDVQRVFAESQERSESGSYRSPIVRQTDSHT